jgi:hypothetical protein
MYQILYHINTTQPNKKNKTKTKIPQILAEHYKCIIVEFGCGGDAYF